MNPLLAKQRFIDTFKVVSREEYHLSYSCHKLFASELSIEKLAGLDNDPELAETIEAFASRFSRMQDTMAGKLFPLFLQAQAETPGTQLETLNRMEKLGLLNNVEHWLEARELRNRLVHEYVDQLDQFKHHLKLARDYFLILAATHKKIGDYACRSLRIAPAELEL